MCITASEGRLIFFLICIMLNDLQIFLNVYNSVRCIVLAYILQFHCSCHLCIIA